MKRPAISRRTMALIAMAVPLLALFAYVALRSGPLAPIAVTVATVEERGINPRLFGIGTTDARYTYRIGPTTAGRVLRIVVDVGDRVKAGQVMGEMDPVDLDDRVAAQAANFKRATATLSEAEERLHFATTQAARYQALLEARSTSQEAVDARQQELRVAAAALAAVRGEEARARADWEALISQRRNLRLVSPVDGVVIARDGEAGTTVVAGQPVLQVIEPRHVWVSARFDQGSAQGLRTGLGASVVLRSRGRDPVSARIARVEPRADAVTEELLARVAFNEIPDPPPPLGELTEITVDLPPLPAAPVVPNAALQRRSGVTGVWLLVDGSLRFTPITPGAADLEGLVQVRAGLKNGDRVVVHSAATLRDDSRIRIVPSIPGAPR